MALPPPVLGATTSSGTVTLTWTPSPKAKQVEIQRNGAKVGPPVPDEGRWIDRAVVAGATYQYTARFRHPDSPWSSPLRVTVPAVPPVPPPIPPVPPAPMSDWPTYGHDAQRTSASPASVGGPLGIAWTWRPASANAGAVAHAVADASGVYVRYRTRPPMASCLARLAPDGATAWVHERLGYNMDYGHWAALGPDGAVVASDAMHVIGRGMATARAYWDCWGEVALSPDGRTIYSLNMSDQDNRAFSLCVWAWALANGVLTERWRAMEAAIPAYRWALNANGHLAMTPDGGRLLVPFLPWIDTTRTETPDVVDAIGGWDAGLYAFDAGGGPPVWHVPGAPMSGVSIMDGYAYVVEKPEAYAAVAPRPGYEIQPGTLLCCYKVGGAGALAWSQPVDEASYAAPCLAGSLVIVATRDGVAAFDRLSGEPRWTAVVPGAGYVTRRNLPYSPTWHTSLAAALGSGTLVVAGDDLHLLDLETGAVLRLGHPGEGKAINPIIGGDGRVYVIDTLDAFPDPTWMGPPWREWWGNNCPQWANDQWPLLALGGG